MSWTVNRGIRRTAVAVLGVALLGATGPVVPTTTATAARITNAQRCTVEKQDVRAAKRALTKAKKAKGSNAVKARKVRTAKRVLTREVAQQSRLCALARTETTVLRSVARQSVAYERLAENPVVAQLPLELREALQQLADTALAELELLDARARGASAGQLSRILSTLRTLDPRTLETAVAELVAELSGTLNPDDVAVTLALLLSDLDQGLSDDPAFDTIVSALGRVVALAEGFDPAGDPDQVQELIDELGLVKEHLAASPQLVQGLLDVVTGALEGGTSPLETAVRDLLGLLGLGGR